MSRYYTDDSNAFVGRRRSIWKQVGWNLLRDLRIPYFDVNPRPVGEVLDVGCGYGDILLYLQSRGLAVSELTPTPELSRGPEYGLDVRLGPLEQQRFSAASFDTVVLCHSARAHACSPRSPGGSQAGREASRHRPHRRAQRRLTGLWPDLAAPVLSTPPVSFHARLTRGIVCARSTSCRYAVPLGARSSGCSAVAPDSRA